MVKTSFSVLILNTDSPLSILTLQTVFTTGANAQRELAARGVEVLCVSTIFKPSSSAHESLDSPRTPVPVVKKNTKWLSKLQSHSPNCFTTGTAFKRSFQLRGGSTLCKTYI